jgi:hypothetical protein
MVWRSGLAFRLQEDHPVPYPDPGSEFTLVLEPMAQERPTESTDSELPIWSIDSAPLALEVFIFLVFGILFSVALTLAKPIAGYQRTVVVPRSASKIPCKRCQFYSHNPHLQCAVHPFRAFTPDAVHCSDYHPESSPSNF